MAVKKEDILEAANQCFFRYGYAKTSMSDIGKLVGLNKASLYYHYKDKLSIYKATVDLRRQEHELEVRAALGEADSIDEEILVFLEKEIDFASKTSRILTLDPVSLHATKSETFVVYEDIIKRDIVWLKDRLDQGCEKGIYKSCDNGRLGELLMTLAQSMLDTYCPLYVEDDKRDQAYAFVKSQIRFGVGLILDGIRR